jgi:energy-coupling factor transporter ATP-binding protein EcfA2
MNNGTHEIFFFDAEKKLQGGKKPCTILIIGKRNSGKTTVVASLARCLRHVPYGVCCSCTEDANAYWSNHIPGRFIHGEYTEDITQNLIEMQRRQAQKVGQDNVQPCFAIYDDIMYDASFARQKTTRELFMNGRHFKISLLLTAQYCMDLPPALRTNIDYVFILKDPIRRNRQRLYENFAGIFPTFESFCDALDQTTENYECMVIDNTTNSNKISDIVFYYKGKPNEQFKMGCREYRMFGIPCEDDAKKKPPKNGRKHKHGRGKVSRSGDAKRRKKTSMKSRKSQGGNGRHHQPRRDT